MNEPLNPEFPRPVSIRGRLFFARSEIERHKAGLLGRVWEPGASFIDTFVPAAEVARELGFGRRTLGRRISAARETTSDEKRV